VSGIANDLRTLFAEVFFLAAALAARKLAPLERLLFKLVVAQPPEQLIAMIGYQNQIRS